jgi:putative ABC transport system permease protein
VSFRSRTEYAAELETDNRRLALVGMSLCVIVLFIGVLNFINTTITNIMARKYELAMLQAIGMTVKQSKNMLTLECLYFVLIAAGIFVSAGYALTFGIVRAFTESSEAYTYHFTFLPLLLCFLPLCAFAFILPQLVYRSISHSSVVERLREIA